MFNLNTYSALSTLIDILPPVLTEPPHDWKYVLMVFFLLYELLRELVRHTIVRIIGRYLENKFYENVEQSPFMIVRALRFPISGQRIADTVPEQLKERFRKGAKISVFGFLRQHCRRLLKANTEGIPSLKFESTLHTYYEVLRQRILVFFQVTSIKLMQILSFPEYENDDFKESITIHLEEQDRRRLVAIVLYGISFQTLWVIQRLRSWYIDLENTVKQWFEIE